MTLHEAIELLLRESRRPMRPSDIARSINERRLYFKGDKSLVTGSQVSARVAKYPHVFKLEAAGIGLHDISTKPYRDLLHQLLRIFTTSGFSNAGHQERQRIAVVLVLVYFNKLNDLSLIPGENSKAKILEAAQHLEKELTLTKGGLTSIFKGINDLVADEIDWTVKSFHANQWPQPSRSSFSKFFNEVLNSFNWKDEGLIDDHHTSTPIEVARWMISLYDLPKKASLFDPFAGKAGLLVELQRHFSDSELYIFAGDSNTSMATIGSLNLQVSGQLDVHLKNVNAFNGWPEELEADFIFSNPPFNASVQISDKPEWQKINSTDGVVNAIQLFLHHLRPGGKAIVVVPQIFLYSQSAAAIRTWLVEENALHGVITLPGAIYQPLAVRTAIITLEKKSGEKEHPVFIYDALDSSIDQSEEERSRVSTAYKNKGDVEGKGKWVSKQEIINNDYELTPKKYLLGHFPDEEYDILKHFVDKAFVGSNISSANLNPTEGTAYIQIGDLLDSEGLEALTLQKIKSFVSDLELLGRTPALIPSPSILVARIGSKLKPTLYAGGWDAIASSSVIVLPVTSTASTGYLISQLQSDYVLKQLDAARRTAAIPNISLSNLLSIRIRKRTLAEQREFVAAYYSRKLADVQQAQIKLKEDELYNLISRIKHEIKQPVSSIGIDIAVLAHYLTEREASGARVALSDFAIAPLPGQSTTDLDHTRVTTLLQRIAKAVAEAQQTLRKAEETINIGQSVMLQEDVDLKSFLDKEVISAYRNENCTIQLTGTDEQVQADKYQLKVLFRHLIDNAIKHGFRKERSKSENMIKIQVAQDTSGEYAEIKVMNNGVPPASDFEARLLAKGMTTNRDTGTGFGGYHVKTILENHKGLLTVSSEEATRFSDFKAQINIYLPI